jgi:hypothetical protein
MHTSAEHANAIGSIANTCDTLAAMLVSALNPAWSTVLTYTDQGRIQFSLKYIQLLRISYPFLRHLLSPLNKRIVELRRWLPVIIYSYLAYASVSFL